MANVETGNQVDRLNKLLPKEYDDSQPKHVHGPWIVVDWVGTYEEIGDDRFKHYSATKVACSSCLAEKRL